MDQTRAEKELEEINFVTGDNLLPMAAVGTGPITPAAIAKAFYAAGIQLFKRISVQVAGAAAFSYDVGHAVATEHLAKYQEHVTRDLASALAYASRLPVSPGRDHRINRIRRKMNREACEQG